ncbi:hypothetical protein [Nitratireductor mangrovi]|nr:hypothetical protein [Nitratireductor mangrovi]
MRTEERRRIVSWCDKLFSVPSAGFGLEPHFASGSSLLDSLSPLLNKIAADTPTNITVEKNEPFAFEFSGDDGFKYGIDFHRVFVNFQHKMRFRSVSGGLPVGELLSSAQPYTTLLPTILDRLVEATLCLPRSKERHITRTGIVSTTDVDEKDLPPGLTRLITYFRRPWIDVTGGFSVNITGIVDNNDEHTDRCIHQIKKSDDQENTMLSVKLDWQRNYRKIKPITKDVLKEELERARRSALAYFEDVGEGNRFDEEILRSTTNS